MESRCSHVFGSSSCVYSRSVTYTLELGLVSATDPAPNVCHEGF